MRIIKLALLAFLLVFILPALLHAAVWLSEDRPGSWHSADWSSARVLPDPADEPQASIRVMYARTGGLKGALAVHSWLVVKDAGATAYERYDVVGWGTPVRRDHKPADGYWYSNPPQVAFALTGDEAARLMPRLRRAIDAYAWSQRGSYRIWPGPNSNTFVATILREVPELAVSLPPTAIGRDFMGAGLHVAQLGSGGWTASAAGLVAVTAGLREGIELSLFGLVAGFRPLAPAIVLPGFGVLGAREAVAAPAPLARASD